MIGTDQDLIRTLLRVVGTSQLAPITLSNFFLINYSSSTSSFKVIGSGYRRFSLDSVSPVSFELFSSYKFYKFQ
jgi:hypothetical protein